MLEEFPEKHKPVNWREQRVFRNSDENKSNNSERRTFECAIGANPQHMTNRKQIWIWQQVGVRTNGCAAIRAEIDQRIVRCQAPVTKRGGIIFGNLGRNLIVPRIRTNWSIQQPVGKQPKPIASQHGESHKTDCCCRITRHVIRLGE